MKSHFSMNTATQTPSLSTSFLLEDIRLREDGWRAADRVEQISHLIQKSAFVCLAGILPLGAAREYQYAVPPGLVEVYEPGKDKKATKENNSAGLDLSTLQDLVSGVGVILGSDFSLPRPETAARGAEAVRGNLMV